MHSRAFSGSENDDVEIGHDLARTSGEQWRRDYRIRPVPVSASTVVPETCSKNRAAAKQVSKQSECGGAARRS
jgi:hypothetical protein